MWTQISTFLSSAILILLKNSIRIDVEIKTFCVMKKKKKPFNRKVKNYSKIVKLK